MKNSGLVLGAGFVFSLLYLSASPTFAGDGTQEISSKSKYGPQATRLHDQHEFIANHVAPDYWALSPYYVPQQDESACILASFTMTLNAMRATEKLVASDKLITQALLLKTLANEPPAKRFYIQKGKTISLDEMAGLFKVAANELVQQKVQVDVLHAGDKDANFAKKLEKILIENEKSSRDFVVANFLQSEYTGDPEGAVGHVSPVAAYDQTRQRVLIFDSDREYYEPYWVSLVTFIKGLKTFDKDAGQNRGVIFIHE